MEQVPSQKQSGDGRLSVAVGTIITDRPRTLTYQPPSTPIGLSSELLQRRPDIADAERRMAEANQQIGITRAAYYPTVSLGAAGFEGTHIANLLAHSRQR